MGSAELGFLTGYHMCNDERHFLDATVYYEAAKSPQASHNARMHHTMVRACGSLCFVRRRQPSARYAARIAARAAGKTMQVVQPRISCMRVNFTPARHEHAAGHPVHRMWSRPSLCNHDRHSRHIVFSASSPSAWSHDGADHTHARLLGRRIEWRCAPSMCMSGRLRLAKMW